MLPLKKNNERIAVIGPNADDVPMMWGNYNGTPNRTVTILDGIRAKHKNVKYIKGCDLTDTMVVDPLFDACMIAGKRGLRGTFWNNTTMTGKPVTTQYYHGEVAATTAGMHSFAPGVKVEGFSAKYETVLLSKRDGEAVLKVEGCGDFEVWVNGKQMQLFGLRPAKTIA